MRKSLVLATLVVFACAAVAVAGVPAPDRSGTGQGTPPAGCQWRFNAAGSADTLTLCITLRDAFDVPVVACSTSVTLALTAGPNPEEALGVCSGNLRATASTDSGGVAKFVYGCIGGRGNVTASFTAHCSGDIGIPPGETFQFTSPDLNASLEATNSTTVGDLGKWAEGLTAPGKQWSDWNCSGGIATVGDLGGWATGLSKGCNDCPFND